MPGSIFDANTLRNFVLVGCEHLLLLICPRTFYWGSIVEDELELGAPAFYREHRYEIECGNTQRLRQYQAFHEFGTRVNKLGFVRLEVTTAKQHEEMMQFFGCLVERLGMDEGEAESFALAAFRELTFFSDDFQAKQFVLRYNGDPIQFGCPAPGQDRPPHAIVPIHSTTWLLLKAIQQGHVSRQEAERYFDEMRSVWGHHPGKTLGELEEMPQLYW